MIDSRTDNRMGNRLLDYGDLVEVRHQGKVYRRKIVKLGGHSPFLDHVMVAGILHWFHALECRYISHEESRDYTE